MAEAEDFTQFMTDFDEDTLNELAEVWNFFFFRIISTIANNVVNLSLHKEPRSLFSNFHFVGPIGLD